MKLEASGVSETWLKFKCRHAYVTVKSLWVMEWRSINLTILLIIVVCGKASLMLLYSV